MPLTLLPPGLARKGYVFQYMGAAPECMTCKYYTVCQGKLESGRKYEVIEVRDVFHECPLRGEVVVVKVKLASIKVIIPKAIAVPGAVIVFKPVCENSYHPLCNPEGIKTGDRIKIIGCKESIDKERIICTVEIMEEET